MIIFIGLEQFVGVKLKTCQMTHWHNNTCFQWFSFYQVQNHAWLPDDLQSQYFFSNHYHLVVCCIWGKLPPTFPKSLKLSIISKQYGPKTWSTLSNYHGISGMRRNLKTWERFVLITCLTSSEKTHLMKKKSIELMNLQLNDKFFVCIETWHLID